MATYTVTVVRTITVEIPVEAASAAEARRAIEEYGAGNAIMDYAGAQDIDDLAVVKTVRKGA